jgi:hydrogenase maturation factor HypF (carbamoyltransferase family)
MAAPSCLDEGRGLRVRGVVQGVVSARSSGIWRANWACGAKSRTMARGADRGMGRPHALDALTRRLAEEAPPLAHVTSVEPLPLPEGRAAPEAFRIVHSGTEGQGALIRPTRPHARPALPKSTIRPSVAIIIHLPIAPIAARA